MNEALHRALARSRLTDTDIAARLDVDPKTVRRWLAGQKPHPRHRWAIADLLGVDQHDLWPAPQRSPSPPPSATGVHRVYPHRWAVPHSAWRELFEPATEHIAILVYSGLFLADDPGIRQLFQCKASEGVSVRLLLGDPDSPHVHQRGTDEGIGADMAAKIRNALVLWRPLMATEGIELRLHSTVLYNSIYRADDQLLINPHIYGAPATATPVLHIDAATCPEIAETYLHSLQRTWETANRFTP